MSVQLVEVEVLPGLVLALLPCENVDEIRSQLAAFFDEVERYPGLGDELTDDEIDSIFGDPLYAQWVAEGSPTCGCDWLGDYEVLPATWRDDYIGD